MWGQAGASRLPAEMGSRLKHVTLNKHGFTSGMLNVEIFSES